MKTVFSILLISSSVAFGQSAVETTQTEVTQEKNTSRQSISEFLYFPSEQTKRISITPNLITEKRIYKSGNDKREREYQTQQFVLKYNQTVIRPDLALSVGTTFGDTKQTVTTSRFKENFSTSGLGDVTVGLAKLNMVDDESRFYYGANLSLSPAAEEFATRSKSGNNYSGGTSIAPYLAYETAVAYGNFGVSMGHQIFGERKGNGDGYNITTTGGNATKLTLFTEYEFSGSNTIGLSASSTFVDEADVDDSEDGKYTYDRRTLNSGRLYGVVQLSNKFTLVPAISYQTVSQTELNGFKYDQNDSLGVSIALNASVF